MTMSAQHRGQLMKTCAKLSVAALAGLSAVGVLASATAGATVTQGPVTDDIGVIVIPHDAPIEIGGY
jgi:branched-chain amino acid transport system substrate-binding protein